MKVPRCAAALAVCLLALASGAAAQMVYQCTDNPSCVASPGPACNVCTVNNACTPGNIKLDLIIAPHGTQDRLAKCLTSFEVQLSSTCAVSVSPLNAGSSFVNTIWEGPNMVNTSNPALATGNLYPLYAECPTTATGPVTVVSASTSASTFTATQNARRSQINDAIRTAIEQHIYGSASGGAPNSLIHLLNTQIDWALAGKAVFTNTFPIATTLEYAITQISAANVSTEFGVALTTQASAGLVEGTHFRNDSSVDAGGAPNPDGIGTRCPYGRYGLALNSYFKVCLVCPAGHNGTDGYSCTPCSAGTYSTIGLNSTCTPCPLGTYSSAGSSDCLPCPAGTYADSTGQARCTACPVDSYSWIPGSQACARCVRGVPVKCTQASCVASASAPATSIISVAPINNGVGAGSTCPLTSSTGAYELKVLSKCSAWETNPMRFALEVNGDCSIDMKPIGTDTTCSDPTNNTTPDYGETQIKAYYHWVGGTPEFEIRTLLPSNKTSNTYSSGPMMAIERASGSVDYLKMTFFAAATNPYAAVAMPQSVCTVDSAVDSTAKVFVLGGKVLDLGADDNTVIGYSATYKAVDYTVGCPAGSYPVYAEGTTSPVLSCEACLTGHYCPKAVSDVTATLIPCPAGTYNPYLGRSDPCLTCNYTANLTSYVGASSCNVDYLNTSCPDTNIGLYYDAGSHSCLPCPAGTYRDPATAGVAVCIDCPAGSYSYGGKLKGRYMTVAPSTYAVSTDELGGCRKCPIGEYSPSTGLEGQGTETATTGHCLNCSAGSIAVTDSLYAATATALVAGATTCDACPSGTYQNTADNTQVCVLCASNYYRTGDASPTNNVCNKIPAGYRLADAANNQTDIVLCEVGTISFWVGSTRYPAAEHQCIACAEVDGVLGRTTPTTLRTAHTYAPRKGMVACVACPGGKIPVTTSPAGAQYFNSKATASCTNCAAGTFRDSETISATCATCPAGYEVGPSARQACTLCRPGYNKTTAGLVDFCGECPVNTYMSTPGANSSCTLCPKGYEAPATGSVVCEECAVGWYNSVPGTTCDEAPQGTFTSTTASATYSLCPKGQFNSEMGQDACTPCSPGYYTDAVGSTQCKTCLAGAWSGSQAATCTACQAGYTSSPGVDNSPQGCTRCLPGTFGTSTSKQSMCKACTRGYQCPGFGQTIVSQCGLGTFSPVEGLNKCRPCPVNTFQATAVNRLSPVAIFACTRCPAGQDTRGLVGQSKCQPIRIQTRRLKVMSE